MRSISILIMILCLVITSGFQSPEKEFTIPYEKFVLENGLEVILHEDHSDPIVAVATIMHVGSNREKPGKTGFAHFFEHMSFNDSENVPLGASRKLIPEWGGLRNGGTNSDATIYYEVVPKDAFEKILWMDSDRLGFMINTVTPYALEREKQVVKNEKRERYDNAPYGYTEEIKRSHLYPEDHPYHWTVIGSLPDLQSATLEDVKAFYEEYYGAANASLVIAGDINIEETKKLVKNWFGEIKRGREVKPLPKKTVTLTHTKSLFFEDNFARLPELTVVYPTIEEYHDDSYALQILGGLLSGSRKSPLYKSIVEDKKLAPEVRSYQYGMELAGEFSFKIRANANVDLDSVLNALQIGLRDFESHGFSENELTRIKAEVETSLYASIESILNKAFILVKDNEFIGDPAYISKAAKKIKAITREDINRVYNKYIKGKPSIILSFVPKGNPALAVSEATEANVWIEEIKPDIANEEVPQEQEAKYQKTTTHFDRSEPAFGETPFFKTPTIWKTHLKNGMSILGIESNEIPLINFNLVIKGGHMLDTKEKSGTTNLMGDLMMEGTARKTPAELEEAIGLLGSSISINTSSEELTISARCLSRNFEATVKLVEEILLEPRWDVIEFARLKSKLATDLKGREANPTAITNINFSKLAYGDQHILGTPVSGTAKTTTSISLNDLKEIYTKLSPKETHLLITGDIAQERTIKALGSLTKKWKEKNSVTLTPNILPQKSKSGNIYFIDVPDAKQSVLFIGKLTVPTTHPDHKKLSFANEVLGGGSSGLLTQILRIEKGYTYGAYSFLRDGYEPTPFIIYSSVRANATLPSLEIIHTLLKDYGQNFSKEDALITQNMVVKENTRKYETLSAKLNILYNISKYNYPFNFIEQEQKQVVAMEVDDFKSIINKYLKEEEMIYLITGDASTQLSELSKLGKEVIKLDIDGNIVD